MPKALREDLVNRGDLPPTIFIFDDNSPFDYLEDFDLIEAKLFKCTSFEEIADYVTQVKDGMLGPPAILGIDIHAEGFADFSMFEVDEVVDSNNCGYQLYELVLRHYGPAFEAATTLFFTSFPSDVASVTIEKLRRLYHGDIDHCSRSEVRRKLVAKAIQRKLITTEVGDRILRRGLSPLEYEAFFGNMASRLEMGPAERCQFFGIASEKPKDISALLKLSALGNELIDLLFDISLLLDRMLEQSDKRQYLERLELRSDGRRGMDLVLGGRHSDLMVLKAELEFILGGAIL